MAKRVKSNKLNNVRAEFVQSPTPYIFVKCIADMNMCTRDEQRYREAETKMLPD